MNYDFPPAVFLYVTSSQAPFSNSVDMFAVPFEDPYRNVPGGSTHPVGVDPAPDAPYPAFGAFSVMDPGINSSRVQSWNVTLEQQIGTDWQASVSYLGSYADRLLGQDHINPGNFLGLALHA